MKRPLIKDHAALHCVAFDPLSLELIDIKPVTNVDMDGLGAHDCYSTADTTRGWLKIMILRYLLYILRIPAPTKHRNKEFIYVLFPNVSLCI